MWPWRIKTTALVSPQPLHFWSSFLYHPPVIDTRSPTTPQLNSLLLPSKQTPTATSPLAEQAHLHPHGLYGPGSCSRQVSSPTPYPSLIGTLCVQEEAKEIQLAVLMLPLAATTLLSKQPQLKSQDLTFACCNHINSYIKSRVNWSVLWFWQKIGIQRSKQTQHGTQQKQFIII